MVSARNGIRVAIWTRKSGMAWREENVIENGCKARQDGMGEGKRERRGRNRRERRIR